MKTGLLMLTFFGLAPETHTPGTSATSIYSCPFSARARPQTVAADGPGSRGPELRAERERGVDAHPLAGLP
jgi:hypothetical protein